MWVYENGIPVNQEGVWHGRFDLNSIHLPVFNNLNVRSELSLVQLHTILSDYWDFLSGVLRDDKVSAFDKLNWNKVSLLNSQARIMLSYFDQIGYRIDIEPSLNMSPMENTPVVQYVFDTIQQKIQDIEQELENRKIYNR